MRYTQCFQKIAPSTLEKSCKGEHRQQGEGEEEWEFLLGAKDVQGLCLPLGSSETPPLTLHAHSLRLTPSLAHFGGCGSPCSLCICGCEGSLQSRPWRPSSVPRGGVLGGQCLPFWAAHDLWIQQSLKAYFSGASVYTTHLSRALWAVSQYLWGSHRAPCSEGLSSTLAPPPFSLWQCCSLLCFCSSQVLEARSWQSWEKWTEAFFKESNHKVLLEILFVIFNFYIIWGKGFY